MHYFVFNFGIYEWTFRILQSQFDLVKCGPQTSQPSSERLFIDRKYIYFGSSSVNVDAVCIKIYLRTDLPASSCIYVITQTMAPL